MRASTTSDRSLREHQTEYFRVDDMSSVDGLERALGYLTWKHGRIDRIDSLNEHWLEAEASLTAFDIPGLRSADMQPAKRKSAMKAVYQSAGTRRPRPDRRQPGRCPVVRP